ncbi:MAG: hypothetical protein K9L85_02910 [Candidatus Peribacteraceae bacterium]|nr:hypothetical protein [Candidatus Peribacteraceae bacterium]
MGVFEKKFEPIYVDLDDEVTTIFGQIRKTPHKDIALVIPARAQILQSLVSLKILRFKSEHAGKNLMVVTRDESGRQLAEEAGLVTLESLKAKPVKPKVQPRQEPAKITRRKLKIVELASKVFPQLQKLSRDEIPLAKIDPVSGAKKVWNRVAGAASVEELSEDGKSVLVVRAPSRRILFGLLAGAVALLFFIVYIAVPTATIYVTPRADPISKVVNVTFTDRASSGSEILGTHTIASEFLTLDFSRDIRIGATGQIFSGTSARGEVVLYNRSNRDKFIVPSRLRSPEGIIFHTKRALTIPKSIGDEYGSIVAEVEACITDDPECDCINEPETCEGDFVGGRGNLAPSFFVFPAIPSLSPALFWGESKKDFTGGVTDVTKFISTEDIENVEATVTREVGELAKQELQLLLNQKNELEKRTLTLLDDSHAIAIEILSIDVPPNLENVQQDDFAVGVTARVQAVAYEADDLRALLFEQLETKVHPQKSLVKINFDNAVMQIEESNFIEGSVKTAVTIDGVEEYDIAGESEAGMRLVEKIKSRILGRSASESEAYIRNLPEVANAVISSWPFWARTIPELPENVKFRVRR